MSWVLSLVRHNSNNHVGMCPLRSSKNVTPVCSRWRGWKNWFTLIRKSILRERWLKSLQIVYFVLSSVGKGLTSMSLLVIFFSAVSFVLYPVFVDLSSDLSVPLACETWWATGGGHTDDEYLWIKTQVTHQACVPPPVQWLSAAVQEEGVSDMQSAQWS